MGLREAGFCWFLCLFLRETLGSTVQNSSSTNETLASLQLEHVELQQGGFPVRYRLKSYQLRSPALSPPKQNPLQQIGGQVESLESTQGLEVRISDDLGQGEPDQPQEVFSLLLPHPDLMGPALQPRSKVPLEMQRRVPVQADSVSVRCGEGEVVIEVKQNFLGNGQLIRHTDLTLGGCPAVNASNNVLQFQTELQGCSSAMTMTEDTLIYTFTLMYSPTPISNTFILKTNAAEVGVQCHYQRKHHVSSSSVAPAWTPSSFDLRAKQQLHFSLRLLTEDWMSQRPSSRFFLSDVMHMEAAVLQGHHRPLRVYVDSCVATASPNSASQPRHDFISDHGCFMDAKLTGAQSYFLQRSQEDKLHFQLKAFRFHKDDRSSLYITCRLKATLVSVPIDPQHKACSYLIEAKRWVASGGDNKVCSCCESSCSEHRLKRSLPPDAAPQWEGTVSLGPIQLEERHLEEELMEQSQLLSELVSQLQISELSHSASLASSSSFVALLAGLGAALVLLLLVLMGAGICSRLQHPGSHSVCT